MIEYQVRVDEKTLARALALFKFIGGNSADAVRVAINKSGPRIRTMVSKRIRGAGGEQRYSVRLKAQYVNDRLKFTKATRQTLRGAIRTPSRGVLLSRYSTDPTISGDKVSWISPPPVPPRGIRVSVKPGRRPTVVTRHPEGKGKPWYLVLNNGRLAIAMRRKTTGPRGGKILVLHGRSVSQVFNDAKDDVLPDAEAEFTRQMVDAMRYLLRRERPRE